MNPTQAAITRALGLAVILDVEHTPEELHKAFRAVRHELRTLQGIHVPQAPERPSELKSARTGRATQPGSLRHKILGALTFHPMADFEIVTELRRDAQAPSLHDVQRRRHELMAAGWVEPALLGNRVRKVVQPSTRRECTVYQLTDLGMAALRRLRSGQQALFPLSGAS